MISKEELDKALKNGVVTVTFVKKNGEIREMNCTLQPDVIPKVKPQLLQEGEELPDTFTVWDTEIDQWRSFNYTSLTLTLMANQV